MKTKRKSILITSILIMASIWGFIAIQNTFNPFKGLELFIFILIVVLGAIAFVQALKKDKDERAGIPVEDELSNRIKYKTGYYAFLISMYMWLFIFIFKYRFPDIETMLGGGILMSGLIFFITKLYVKRQFNE